MLLNPIVAEIILICFILSVIVAVRYVKYYVQVKVKYQQDKDINTILNLRDRCIREGSRDLAHLLEDLATSIKEDSRVPLWKHTNRIYNVNKKARKKKSWR